VKLKLRLSHNWAITVHYSALQTKVVASAWQLIVDLLCGKQDACPAGPRTHLWPCS
jgi:hypothetical protein